MEPSSDFIGEIRIDRMNGHIVQYTHWIKRYQYKRKEYET